MYQNIDRGVLETTGPTGIYKFFNELSGIQEKFFDTNIVFKEKLRNINLILYSFIFILFNLTSFTFLIGLENLFLFFMGTDQN